MPIKSNPFVYPYKPFRNLADKKLRAVFLRNKSVSTRAIGQILQKLPPIRVPEGSGTAKTVFTLLQSETVRFGPKSLTSELRDYWLAKLAYFISENRQVQFSILGFPFKMPIPLKTDRTLPDMGELLSLSHLNSLCESIRTIYPPGAKITVFAEGVFGKFIHLTENEYHSYKDYLDYLVKTFKLKNVEVHNLDEMEKLDKNFHRTFTIKLNTIRQLYNQKNPDMIKKYAGTYESIYRIVNTKEFGVTESELMDAYNENLPDHRLSPAVFKIRQAIRDSIPNVIFNYLAYLGVRDDLDFINKIIPGAVTLSVSPKKYRIGIQPIDKNIIRLPYHGVVVYHRRTDAFTIEYLIDLKRLNSEIIPVYWSSDQEHLPFYYEI